ncbi:hypothetical protein BpHYR1_009050 [Brachionus plicatilis]|uniref:Uncharacterized protein n=1 Tax=Brachionus plicatilis TaxID=10195 RepID=A0A3M7SVK4_BRAPC|nr:hypothetical protein BpHYR1_009050 [Brachionus plicatilis]
MALSNRTPSAIYLTLCNGFLLMVNYGSSMIIEVNLMHFYKNSYHKHLTLGTHKIQGPHRQVENLDYIKERNCKLKLKIQVVKIKSKS